MAALTISKSLNKAYRQVSVDKSSFDVFKSQLKALYEQIATIDTEEKLKGDLMDFLKLSFYGQNYKVSPNGKIDCAIHLGNTIEDPVGVIIEVKMPTNVSEMITRDNLNKKALQELLLYYLRERVGKKNIQLKQLVVTNIYEFFIFDAQEFERIFYSNKKLVKRFEEFKAGELTSDKTEFFYKEIASDYISQSSDKLTFTYFDIRDYKKHLDKGNDRRLIELYKVFSPEHLLKKSFMTDSNKLNTKFYSELLYIIGLEEVEDKDSHKRIITRRKEAERNQASILENAINVLDSEDLLDYYPERFSYGKDRKEQLFNIALSLTISWVNRILFLKLLEAQLIKYHKCDSSYSFMNLNKITDYDELNKLFFQVLAKRPQDRKDVINAKYGKVPYLNSSLFEVSSLEKGTIRISNLENHDLPLFGGTVLREGTKPRYRQLPTLRYLLEFLDAYDFASEGNEEIQENAKPLINASVLGLIFEKINGHKDGSVFTPGAVTMYMSREAIQQTVVWKFNEVMGWTCKDYEALRDKDIEDYVKANALVDSLRICDPAVGSGHFLVSVLNEIIRTKYDLGILLDCDGKRIKKQDYNIDIENDELLVSDEDGLPFVYVPGNPESQRVQEALFKEKRTIIENCLFGVDLNPNAVNICCLRLWIELLKNAYYTKESGYTELETLPNIDINIKVGNSLIHRFALNQDISEILKKSGVSISDYRNAVSQYKNAHSKDEKHALEETIQKIKDDFQTYIGQHDPRLVRKYQIERELDKVSAPLLFEVSKKEQAQRDKQAKELQKKLANIQKEIDDIRNNRMFVGAFEWRIEFPEVLDEEGNFEGFDCIIGNPPYIQLQKMGTDADALQKMNYDTYERTGDIYCLFYEMGMKLLRPGALLSFITSNGWMKSAYGQSLRSLFAEKYAPSLLVDFAGYKVFESATVDVNILSLRNEKGGMATKACSIDKTEFDITKLSDYVQTHAVDMKFNDSDSWAILSEIEKSIKSKVDAVGTPLKDWDIQINFGIKTGFNDAFIIDSQTRDEILSKCTCEYERVRTTEIIRPILRGRDIKRYSYQYADLYLVSTFPTKGYEIDDYPAVKDYLLRFGIERLEQTGKEYIINGERVKARKKTSNKWYETQDSISYWDLLSQPKIIWGEISDKSKFCIDLHGRYVPEATTFMLSGENLIYLLAFLNCSVSEYLFSIIGTTTGVGTVRWKKYKILELPVPKSIPNDLFSQLLEVCSQTIESSDNDSNESKINSIIYQVYGLSEDEIEFIESKIYPSKHSSL